MKKQFVVIIGILAVLLCVSSVMALTVPGQKNGMNYIPVYDNGKIVSYVVEMPPGLTPVQVSPIRTDYVDAKGKARMYKQTIIQGSSSSSDMPYYDTGEFSSPYPATWDPSVMKFTSVQYTTYCLENGIPKRGTFAINLPSGAWMK